MYRTLVLCLCVVLFSAVMATAQDAGSNKDSDAKAYRASGMRALILGDAGGVQGAEEVSGWQEIDSMLFGGRVQRFEALHGVGGGSR